MTTVKELEEMEKWYSRLAFYFVKADKIVPTIYNDILDLIEELKQKIKGEK